MVDKQHITNTFIDDSLGDEDKSFIDFVYNILDSHRTKPFGTVVRFSASSENLVNLIS